MSKETYDFLNNHFNLFEKIYNESKDCIEIVKPQNECKIIVDYIPEDDFSPYLVSWSYQHRHLVDEDDVIEYVNEIINCKVYAIECFKGDTAVFGGEIRIDDFEDFSYETLEKWSGYFGLTKLLDCVDTVKVRFWHGGFDATFAYDKDGKPTVILQCDECGSKFILAKSKMMSLCPECAHILFGYENCNHQFKDGKCELCHWDGSRSDYIKKLVENNK